MSDNGDAAVALLGAIHLAGLTPGEARILLEARLRQGGFVIDPHVSIMIREYGTQGVTLTGEVKKPGVYPIVGAHNLLDIMSMAGGTTPYAAHYATIKRRVSPAIITASLSNEPSDLLASNPELQPGDTIVVPKAGIVYVIGDVGRPGGFVMQTSGEISLLQAVSLAAGPNRTAAASKTHIIRKTASGFEETKVNLKRMLQGKTPDVPLQAEDIVYVPPSTAKSFLQRAPGLAQTAANSVVYAAVP